MYREISFTEKDGIYLSLFLNIIYWGDNWPRQAWCTQNVTVNPFHSMQTFHPEVELHLLSAPTCSNLVTNMYRAWDVW